MKLSQLAKQLQHNIKEYGDQDVLIWDDGIQRSECSKEILHKYTVMVIVKSDPEGGE
jgi:N-acetyl-beta-hexosaminidase